MACASGPGCSESRNCSKDCRACSSRGCTCRSAFIVSPANKWACTCTSASVMFQPAAFRRRMTVGSSCRSLAACAALGTASVNCCLSIRATLHALPKAGGKALLTWVCAAMSCRAISRTWEPCWSLASQPNAWLWPLLRLRAGGGECGFQVMFEVLRK